MLSDDVIDRITRRGVSDIISRDEFVRMLGQGTPLRLKMGFDPSRPDIHLGHVVGLRKLHQLQELGHQVILIVGDWTAQIGDPSGQSATRPVLTHDEVVANAESYLRQFFKVVDKDRTQVVWQSEWFGKFTLEDVIKLTGKFTVAQFLERDDFAKRFHEHRPIAITELLYPCSKLTTRWRFSPTWSLGAPTSGSTSWWGVSCRRWRGSVPSNVSLCPFSSALTAHRR